MSMMNEEENKIIDRINKSYDDNTQYVEASAKDWNCIVHLIRKQEKEIEEKNIAINKMSIDISHQLKEIEELKQELINLSIADLKELNNYISKDKIKEKLEELEEQKEKYFEKQIIQGRIDLLQELLEDK